MQEITHDRFPIPASSKLERTLAAAGASAIVTGSAVVWYFDPTKVSLFPVCPLYTMTGFACPGCGLTRGFHALFHGDIVTALDFNAILPLFGLLIASAFVSMTYFAIRGTKFPVDLLHPVGMWALFYSMIAFGVLRNLPWYPFTLLFP